MKTASKIFAASLALSLLAGCAQLPTGVNVQAGPSISAEAKSELSFYSPARPSTGAQPEAIVSGFLNAGTGPQNEYGVAREYLTGSQASNWRPNTEVLIRSGAPIYQKISDSEVLVDITVIARVDEAGRYHRLASPETRTLRFELQQLQGEWRIGEAPNLTVVTTPVFDVVFKKYSIYFVDSSYTYLVPQSRWFAPSASTPTRLVNSLLDGPGDELLGSLRTGIPPETQLSVQAVRVTEGTAFIDLDQNALQADAAERRLMLSQLQSTLRDLSNVSQVMVSISSNPQDITAAEISIPSTAGQMVVLKNDGVYRVSGQGASLIPSLTSLSTQSAPSQFDFDEANRYVQISASGFELVEPTRLGIDRKTLSTDTTLIDPQFDVFGFAWAASKSEGRMVAFTRSGAEIQLNQSKNNRLLAFQISPDGARIAEVRGTSTGSELILRGVIRDAAGTPRAIVGRVVVPLTQGQPLDASWSGMEALTVLESVESGAAVIGKYQLDGPWQRLPATPTSAISVQASPAGTSQHFLTEQYQVWSLSGSNWLLMQDGVIDIAFTR